MLSQYLKPYLILQLVCSAAPILSPAILTTFSFLFSPFRQVILKRACHAGTRNHEAPTFTRMLWK